MVQFVVPRAGAAASQAVTIFLIVWTIVALIFTVATLGTNWFVFWTFIVFDIGRAKRCRLAQALAQRPAVLRDGRNRSDRYRLLPRAHLAPANSRYWPGLTRRLHVGGAAPGQRPPAGEIRQGSGIQRDKLGDTGLS